jgi:hypothetical protein
MAESIRLQVEVDSDAVIVTMPGTTFRVVYRIPTHAHGLIAFDVRGSREASVTMAEFLARAWKLANDKARELGWIV